MADDDVGIVQDDYKDEPANSSKPYLDAIHESEKAFEDYQERADRIDKLYADLKRLASIDRSREFQLFWANIEVLKPSIYSRPPVPVVTPRFKDRRPVPRMASELLERCAVVGFEMEDIDQVMRAVRDDLAIQARGVAWVRYESEDGQRCCIDSVDRKDFLHGLARVWKEVPWVAYAAHLTRDEMKERFAKHSGDAYLDAEYSVSREDKEKGAVDSESKCRVWEIWHKDDKKVIWVTKGVDVVLDKDDPHLKLEGFFPCPRPAYGTLERRSLKPVPEMVFIKDQLEEINEMTGRIAALSEAVKVRGFYPAGSGEIGDAIEAALKATSDNQIMVPISNWAAFGNSGAKDMIVWLPIEIIGATIQALVEIRRQLIEDVYQIYGLSDIMRGSTDPNETLGAQELKSQYGSIRVRDRQNELVRVARDLTRIMCEIMAENYSKDSLLDMSQLEIKTDADLKDEEQQAIAAAQAKVKEAMANPEMAQQAQQNPQAAQQMLAQLEQQTQAQIDKINEQPTIEKVMKLLREQKLRPFVLDIETDSTIAPDENAQKQRATEFITAFGGAMAQALPLVQEAPQAAPLMAEALKYVASQFRAGRQMEGAIEEFADSMSALAQQPKQDPMAAKGAAEAQAIQQTAQIEAQRAQLEQQTAQAEQQRKEQEAAAGQEREDAKLQADLVAKHVDDQRKALESDLRVSQMQADDQRKAQEHAQKLDLGALAIEKLRLEIEGVQVKTAATQAVTEAKIDQTETQTDNSIRSTDASVQATADSTAIKAAAAKEPA